LKYSIIFAGSNNYVLEYLAHRNDISVEYCFFHGESGDLAKIISCCKDYGLKYAVVKKNKQILEILKVLPSIKIGICSSFIILDEKVYNWPEKGFINIHPSYLPSYKGANPFYYMLMNNEKEGGVTVHEITNVVDGGDILAQARYPVSLEDDISMLIEKANKLSTVLLENNLDGIIHGAVKKNKNTGGGHYPPVTSRQWINLSMLPMQIYNLVRSQTIYGGCLLKRNEKEFIVEGVILNYHGRDSITIGTIDKSYLQDVLVDGDIKIILFSREHNSWNM